MKLENREEFLLYIKEQTKTAKGSKIREELKPLGYDWANMMDAGNPHPELALMTFELVKDRILELLVRQSDQKRWQDDRRNAKNQAERNEIDTLLGGSYEAEERLITLIRSINDTAHYFANVAFNKTHRPIGEWRQLVQRIMSFDDDHLPDESCGFLSILNVDSLQGMENFILVRDLVFDLYISDRDKPADYAEYQVQKVVKS